MGHQVDNRVDQVDNRLWWECASRKTRRVWPWPAMLPPLTPGESIAETSVYEEMPGYQSEWLSKRMVVGASA
jgi:hypothetical protein